MNIRKSILSGFLATSMALGGATAFAQDIQDPTDGDDDNNKVEVALLDKDGRFVATADFEETDDGVKIVIDDTDNEILSEGWLGVHIHEVGSAMAAAISIAPVATSTRLVRLTAISTPILATLATLATWKSTRMAISSTTLLPRSFPGLT